MSRCSAIILDFFREPIGVEFFADKDWDVLVRQARATRLLASVYYVLKDNKLLDIVPDRVLPHLVSASKQSAKTRLAAQWELELIDEVAVQFPFPFIILKGAAYVALNLTLSRGRLFSDIDILVPHKFIQDVELAFLERGWSGTKVDAYDQQYYRQWMHELPPLLNKKTASVLDLHHSILPKTSTIQVDASKLISDARALSQFKNLATFSSEDMLLHSATHLFHEGEFDHGLRDIFDLSYLFIQFGCLDSKFWVSLEKRAVELGLMSQLYYAFYHCRDLLGAVIPEAVYERCEKQVFRSAMLTNFFFSIALMPDHKTCDTFLTPYARWVLYVRSHYLRMPIRLLIPHLLRKAYREKVNAKLNDTEDIQ